MNSILLLLCVIINLKLLFYFSREVKFSAKVHVKIEKHSSNEYDPTRVIFDSFCMPLY